MAPTVYDTQFLARRAHTTVSTFQIQLVLIMTSVIIGITVFVPLHGPARAIQLFVVLVVVLACGRMWTAYSTGPLARTVMHQQAMITQLQRDLAALREHTS